MRRTLALSLATLASLSVPAAAGAQDELPPLPSDGGASATPGPEIRAVRCRAGCTGILAQAGATLEIRGARLGEVTRVAFLGGVMPGDEAEAAPQAVAPRRLTVTVPAGAATGPLLVLARDGQTGQSAPVRVARAREPRPAAGPIATAVTLPEAFVDGERAPTLAYRLATAAPADVTVSVLRARDDRVVAEFNESAVPPGQTRLVSWGRRAGAFRFVVDVQGADVTASTAQAAQADAFRIRPFRFPLRGRHDFGDGLGAGRGHQGTDVFAACGTPVTAARGGRVERREFEGRAGNYVVVDQAGSGYDSAYMHLRDAALVAEGDRVRTGQRLGYVGRTGAASECHLHFEYWTPPGWYAGGSAIDARSRLMRWDRVA